MRILIPILLALVALPAAADIDPRYHEAARAAAAGVEVIQVRVVVPEVGADGMGECVIEGPVMAVERGSVHALGEDIAVTVPCFTEDAVLPASPTQWQAVQALVGSNHGRVWLNADGSQLDRRYYQIVD
jgi:hypothetical protein